MSLSSYNPRARYKRKHSVRRSIGFLLFICVLMVFGIGFALGSLKSRQDTKTLYDLVQAFELERETLVADVMQARADAQIAETRYEDLRDGYADVVSEDALKNLVLLLKEQINEGKSIEYLSELIVSSSPPGVCSEPEIKRFVVMSPAYDGPKSEVSIDSGELFVSAQGQPAVHNSGSREVWFDPSKSVNIVFRTKEGEAFLKKGVLPIQHSLVVEDKEYRFTISEGAQSFAKVAFDICDIS